MITKRNNYLFDFVTFTSLPTIYISKFQYNSMQVLIRNRVGHKLSKKLHLLRQEIKDIFLLLLISQVSTTYSPVNYHQATLALVLIKYKPLKLILVYLCLLVIQIEDLNQRSFNHFILKSLLHLTLLQQCLYKIQDFVKCYRYHEAILDMPTAAKMATNSTKIKMRCITILNVQCFKLNSINDKNRKTDIYIFTYVLKTVSSSQLRYICRNIVY